MVKLCYSHHDQGWRPAARLKELVVIQKMAFIQSRSVLGDYSDLVLTITVQPGELLFQSLTVKTQWALWQADMVRVTGYTHFYLLLLFPWCPTEWSEIIIRLLTRINTDTHHTSTRRCFHHANFCGGSLGGGHLRQSCQLPIITVTLGGGSTQTHPADNRLACDHESYSCTHSACPVHAHTQWRHSPEASPFSCCTRCRSGMEGSIILHTDLQPHLYVQMGELTTSTYPFDGAIDLKLTAELGLCGVIVLQRRQNTVRHQSGLQ